MLLGLELGLVVSPVASTRTNILTTLISHAGSTPIDTVPPCAHTVGHYPLAAQSFGVLRWFWLMVFERFNKKMKGLVGNKSCPIASLVNALLRDAGVCLHI